MATEHSIVISLHGRDPYTMVEDPSIGYNCDMVPLQRFLVSHPIDAILVVQVT